MKTYEFKIIGMHCAACELWLEDSLKEIPGVKKVSARLNSNSIKITADLEKNVLEKEMSKVLKENGNYSLGESVEVKEDVDLTYPLLFSGIVIGLFILLQRLNLVSLVNTDSPNLPFVFLLGVVASISTCGATTGALILNLSASSEKNENGKYVLSFFHISRLATFFVLGGVLGYTSSLLGISLEVLNGFRIFVVAVMLLLSLNMLGVNIVSKFLPTLPKIFSSKTFGVSKYGGVVAASLLGLLTFFLPCGFTQSVQLLAISSKSFLGGASTMLVFALGTLPVFLGISKISKSFTYEKKEIFLKTAGFITLAYVVYEIYLLINQAGI